MKKTLATLLFISFLDMLGIGILIPVIPMLFTDPSSPYFVVQSAFLTQYAYVMMGLLLATYPLAQFFAAPILGQLSDKYGRKKILIFSQAGTSLGYLLFALGVVFSSLPILFISRIIDGFTGGNIAVAQAAIADITPPQARARTFGLMGAVFGLGFIIGPFLGGVLSAPHLVSWFSPAVPFWFAAILAGINTVLTARILKETHPSPLKELRVDLAKSVHNIVKAFNYEKLKYLFITALFFQSGFSFFTAFFSVYLIHKFNFSQTDLGNYFGYIGLWIIFTQGVVTPWLSRRVSGSKILSFSMITCALGIALHFAPTQAWQLLIVVPVFALSNGLTQANMMALISRQAGPAIQGEVLGINSSMQALANTIPPLIAGFLAESFSPAAPIIVAVIITTLAGITFIAKKPPEQTAHGNP